MNRYLYILLIASIFTGCSQRTNSPLKEDIQIRFEDGKTFFEKEKYLRAKEEFKFVVMNNPGSGIALDARYFLGDIHFQLEEY